MDRLASLMQEFEKLISFSGTPTVGWRRTGEICLVGAEFTMLTDWSQDSLVGGKKFIWEVRTTIFVIVASFAMAWNMLC